ncbi:MAG: methyltransferase domain-containing protein [Candidatus Omnitrophota bacterium]
MIDKAIVRDNFSRIASQYEEKAILQEKIGKSFLNGINHLVKKSGYILDIGCGSAKLTKEINILNPQAKIFALDLSLAMLEIAKNKCDCLLADAQNLAFLKDSFDLVISNLTYQWINDLSKAFLEAKRILKNNGDFCFTVFGQSTLEELRSVYKRVTKRNIPNILLKKDYIYQNLLEIGFKKIEINCFLEKELYLDLTSLVRWLKDIGTNRIEKPSFIGREKWQKLNNLYKLNYEYDNQVYASFEVIFVKASKYR